MYEGAPASSPDGVDWQQIYDAHAGRLRRIIARRVVPDAVDDVLQDTFLRAYRSRHTHDPARPLGPWLTTIATRAATDSKRLREDDGGFVARPRSGADEEFFAVQQRTVIVAALGSLTSRHRRLLVSIAVDAASPAKLAADEGVDPQALRAAVHRARQSFRAAYTRLLEQAGVAGVGGVLRPGLTRLRGGLQRAEPFVVRVLEVASAAVMAVAVLRSTSPEPVLPLRSAAHGISHVGTAATHERPGANERRSAKSNPDTQSVTLSTPLIVASSTVAADPATPITDGKVTVRSELLGATATVGTGGNTGEVSFEHRGDGRLGAGVGVSDCNANVGTQGECLVIETAEKMAAHVD